MRPFLSMVLLGIYLCITNHKCSVLKQCTLITSQCLHIRNSGIIYLGSLFSNLSQAWNLSTGQGWSPIWKLNWRRFFFQTYLCCCCQDLVPYCCRTEIPVSRGCSHFSLCVPFHLQTSTGTLNPFFVWNLSDFPFYY